MKLPESAGGLKIEAVVFDIGGVLEVNPDLGFRDKWESRLGLKPGSIDEQLAEVFKLGTVGKISESEAQADMQNILKLSISQFQEFYDDLWVEYLGLPNFALIEYFTKLRPRYRTAILSDSFVGAREREQQRYGFGDICDLIVYSHEEGVQKPDQQMYQITSERLGVLPERTLFVDDSPHKVEGARRAGWTALLHENNSKTLKQLEQHLDISYGEDQIVGVTPRFRGQRVSDLNRLFELFEDNDAAAEVASLKEEDDGY